MTTRLVIVPSEFEAARLLSRADAEAGTAGGAARHTALSPAVELLVCGVGLLRAGLAVAARVQRGDVRDALLIGLCGTRDQQLAPASTLVIGTAARNEAFGAGRAAEFLGLGEMGLKSEQHDPELLPLCDVPASALADGRVTTGGHATVRGVFGSVAAASGSLDEARAWHRRHPDVLAEEMEAYAVALACARASVPLACVRAVSNAAGDRELAHWDIAGSIGALRSVLPALLALPPLTLPPLLPAASREVHAPREAEVPREPQPSRAPPAFRASRESRP